ncbi:MULTISPECIES: ribonuclease R [Agrobacterium]|uniref:Ribonuclease R n=1 Tax=Agrobacterium salinitolerans TaxID=1183413 RepID=A0A9X3KJY7_9HYPH|nr:MULTISPECIES: ribonuclease R [Agrobacterium]MCZ7886678.1 ribonuclease R [Agrobacterium salinitolerans]MCZ7936168.1 ribonuclease R [Agrobacterium salinitolerans]MDA5628987.1 ribonuclease R [Agrobacterium sp. ST15.16.055]MDA5638300.1 ribonuclease R [Agrobacterium sp. ST15.13.013]MDA6979664.1 ribonuclease R [Agrobacterium salinitolerans]
MSKAPRQRQGSASDGFGRTGRGKRVSEGEGIIHGEVPSREVLLKFIADHPQQASKREIAKAFGLKGENRIVLKALLKELEVDGMVHKSRKSLTRPGGLPPVTVLDITTRDKDGELIGRPAEWPEDLGAAPAVLIRQSSQDRGKKAPAAGLGDRILAKIFPSKENSGPAYTARVVKLIDRRQNALLGVFKEAPGGGGRLMPIDRRGEEMVIDPDGVGDAKDGDLIEVETSRNSGRYGLTRAKVLSVIGSVASEKAISMIAIHAHGIPHIFPPNVLAEADAAKAATMSHREDWRDLPLITIDPADAKDHDDAVYAEPDHSPDNPDGVIVTVAIADVSWYVRPGAPLDREALKRGNSVYFPDRVVPMLPERISNDLCSLKEGVDRPALAVRMTFSKEGRKASHTFHRIMMKSAAKLSYQQAQAAIDGTPDDKTGPLLEPILKPLWHAYEVMKRGRDRRQPLELDMPERKIQLRPDGTVDKVVIPERLDAHKLIEEMMIQANVAAAETLEKKKQPLVYRVHDAPTLSKQEVLREFLGTIGISMAKGAAMRANSFNGILARAIDTPHQIMVNEMVLRSQSQAIYSPENIGHFGLNLMKYAHFTSPIRRYADLIVHRALVGSLGLGEGGITPQEEATLDDIAAEISTFERRAMAAERDTVNRLIAHHLSERVGEEFEGRVGGVTKAGLFVALPQFGADGFVPISTLGTDYFLYDEAHQALTGEKTGLGYQLGDTVQVRLAEAVPLAGALRFDMLSPGRKMPMGVRSFHKAGRRTARAAAKPGTRPPRRRR